MAARSGYTSQSTGVPPSESPEGHVEDGCVLGIITAANVVPALHSPSSWKELLYTCRSDWFASYSREGDKRKGATALSKIVHEVTLHRQAAARKAESLQEPWSAAWESCAWLDTLGNVSKILSERLEIDLIVKDQTSLRDSIIQHSRAQHDTGRPGASQEAGQWATDQSINRAINDETLADSLPQQASVSLELLFLGSDTWDVGDQPFDGFKHSLYFSYGYDRYLTKDG